MRLLVIENAEEMTKSELYIYDLNKQIWDGKQTKQ